MSSETKMMQLAMRGLVLEAGAELEFKEASEELESIRIKFMQGTDKERVAFIAAFTIFGIDFGNHI